MLEVRRAAGRTLTEAERLLMAARGDRLESLVLTGLLLGLLGSIGAPISVVKTCGQLHGSGVRSHGVAVWGYVTLSVGR